MTNPKPSPKGRYLKGQSGNPAGRPKGGPDRRRALREAIAGDLPEIVSTMVKAAKAGDVQAATLILSRCMPPLRPVREPFHLEGLPESGTAAELARALVLAAGTGKIGTDEAAELIGAIAATARVVEVEELQQRITALEQRGTDLAQGFP